MADPDRPTDGTRGLARLDELRGYKVAEGSYDVRGWTVVADDGRPIGEVKHLIADPAAMTVRYLEVELDRDVSPRADRRTLVPVGAVQLDEERDLVLVDAIAAVDTVTLPTYPAGAEITRDYEASLRDRFDDLRGRAGAPRAADAPPAADREGDDFYADDLYDTGRFDAAVRRLRRRDDEARLTLSEEELDIRKRQVAAGEVGVRKTVETEHVEQQVPVVREEVTVERRPVSADSSQEVTVTDDEIRIPVLEERLVVEKRVVPVEEIVIKKRGITESQTVEADLKKERVDVDRDVTNE
jgi:uncharacterized protein (TIGR02271 family)